MPATPPDYPAYNPVNGASSVDLLPVFDILPTSLWLEDYSGLKSLFDAWRAQGVSDLRAHLLENPARIAECVQGMRVLHVNRRTLTMMGASSQEELVEQLGKVFRDDMLDAYVGELEQLWQGKPGFQSQTVNYTLDGRRLDVLLKGTVLPGCENDWARVLVLLEDITEQETARRRLADSENYARGVFQYAPVSLWVEDFSAIKQLMHELRQQGITDFRTFTDVHPDFVDRCMAEIRVLDVNRHTLSTFKASDKAELILRQPEMFRDEMATPFREQLIELWEGRLFQQREVVNYALDGTLINLHMQFSVFDGYENDWGKVLVALTDITARKKAEQYLEYLGKHDVLTQLKNRSFFVDELSRLKRRGPFPISAIAIDLNNLKETNDTQGHAAGDALLRRIGEVLSKVVDGSSQAARMGGDEFIVLLPGTNAKKAQETCEVIAQLIALSNQYHVGTALSVSMGAATSADGKDLDEMLREADMRMYESKRQYHAARHIDDDGA